MTLLLLASIASVVAVPLPLAQMGDRWSQVCCKDNDINSNGGISFREFTEFALSLMDLNRPELERLFLAGDVDRNSELDGEECISMRKLLKSTLNEKAEFLLEKYGYNISRNLTLDNLYLLARNELGIIPDDAQRSFTLSDQNNDHVIGAGEEMSDVMLKLRTQAIGNARRKLSGFDRNHDSRVSYEEIKPELLHLVDGFTLKQIFKSIDFDKDYYLTTLEYLVLLNELKRHKGGSIISTPRTIDMTMSKITPMPIVRVGRKSAATEVTQALNESAATPDPGRVSTATTWATAMAGASLRIRDRRDIGRKMNKVAPSATIHELANEGKVSVEEEKKNIKTARTKKALEDDDDEKLFDGDDEDKASVLPEASSLPKKSQIALLSEQLQHNLSGGGRTPSIDLSVTVPYDSDDFE
ncbi:hypothetical protein KIN20_036106 [Parelaphostrongylus tenuis]|uniref:EF-hand domain-containing protein n=1 Tax=Parelaphostrongylus tenuis TaxID=148309 RepID=A0AAD5WKZ2_PARTN|nr:hypothetical protein KIN20_036106 [Parelaphostrongylus tenuis]